MNHVQIAPMDYIDHYPIPKLILIIDDNPELSALNCEILENAHYQVLAVSDPREALDLLRTIEPPSLILLDQVMVSMSGSDFLLELAAINPEIIDTVPIVFVTGVTDLPTTKASAVILKPYTVNTLLNCVEHFLKVGPRQIQVC